MNDLPVWVRIACQRWGRQKRRIWVGTDWHGNIDGYAQSLLGRMRDEGDGASQGIPRAQSWPEVFSGDGLAVQLSLQGLGERRHAVLHFQYVWDPQWKVTVREKADYLGVRRREYFTLLSDAEIWVHARLDRAHSNLAEKMHQIVRDALRKPLDSDTRRQTQRAGPQLNLAALDRQVLKLR